jgi:hypothetical protein
MNRSIFVGTGENVLVSWLIIAIRTRIFGFSLVESAEHGMGGKGKEGSGSFLKKRTKKLSLTYRDPARHFPRTPRQAPTPSRKVFLLLFLQKKKNPSLPCALPIDATTNRHRIFSN